MVLRVLVYIIIITMHRRRLGAHLHTRGSGIENYSTTPYSYPLHMHPIHTLKASFPHLPFASNTYFHTQPSPSITYLATSNSTFLCLSTPVLLMKTLGETSTSFVLCLSFFVSVFQSVHHCVFHKRIVFISHNSPYTINISYGPLPGLLPW